MASFGLGLDVARSSGDFGEAIIQALHSDIVCSDHDDPSIEFLDAILLYISGFSGINESAKRATDQGKVINIHCAELFLAGFALGKISERGESFLIRAIQKARASNHQKSTIAASRSRRALTDPKREAAREIMSRRSHLTLSACAKAVVSKIGGDESSTRRAIKPLFVKGRMAKYYYDSGNLKSTQGQSAG